MPSEAAEATERSDQPAPETSPEVPRSSVCVLLPTLNEAATIGEIVSQFRDRGYENVLVIDGGSTDDTREIARERGARVVVQSGEGKGQAIREAINHVEVPYVLMLDGDGTYDPADAERMLEPLAAGYEHVIGDRFADIDPDAMTRLNEFGNRIINRSFRTIHGAAYADILSGYRAFTTDSFERCSPSADGFTIETELAVECVKQGVDTTVVPISYSARPDESETNLRPIRDGGRIIVSLYSLARTNNPLFYFGSIGLGGIVAGGALAAFVLWQWIANGIGHNILALVAAAAILLGVQLLMFGVLSDMIVSLHRDQRRRLERLRRVEGGRVREYPDGSTPAAPDAEYADGTGDAGHGNVEYADRDAAESSASEND